MGVIFIRPPAVFKIPDLPVAANIGQAWTDEKTAKPDKACFSSGNRGEATHDGHRGQRAAGGRERRRPKAPGRRQPFRQLSRARRLRGRSEAAPAAHALWLHFRRRRNQCVTAGQPRQLSGLRVHPAVPRRRLAAEPRQDAVRPRLRRAVRHRPDGRLRDLRLPRRSRLRTGRRRRKHSDDPERGFADQARGGSRRKPHGLVPGLSAGRSLAHRTAGRSRRRRGLRGVRADRGHTGRRPTARTTCDPASAFRSSQAPSSSGT